MKIFLRYFIDFCPFFFLCLLSLPFFWLVKFSDGVSDLWLNSHKKPLTVLGLRMRRSDRANVMYGILRVFVIQRVSRVVTKKTRSDSISNADRQAG